MTKETLKSKGILQGLNCQPTAHQTGIITSVMLDYF